VTGLLRGTFPRYDEEYARVAFRRYAGLTAVATATPRPRTRDVYIVEDPLEEDGMKYFLPEECGRVPTIESVYTPLTKYVRSWLWEIDERGPSSGVLDIPALGPAGPLQRLIHMICGLLRVDGRNHSLSNVLDRSATRPQGPLPDLVRFGEDSSDPSSNRFGKLRAVVSPSLRSKDYFLQCEDDILESILQTSISMNRVALMIFWLIAAFRCGYEEKLLAVISTRLDDVWKVCVDIQGSDVLAMTELDNVAGPQIHESHHKLEVLWTEVFRGMLEARALYRKSGRRQISSCSGCAVVCGLSSNQATSLALSKIANGQVDRNFSQLVKRAAFDPC
jgi:hypothetical protein